MSQTVLRSANAAVQNGVARADGTLKLTDTDLCFTPFNDKFGLGPYTLSRSEITTSDCTSVKAGGIMPLSQDALRITLNSGKHYEFILANVDQWIDLLQHRH